MGANTENLVSLAQGGSYVKIARCSSASQIVVHSLNCNKYFINVKETPNSHKMELSESFYQIVPSVSLIRARNFDTHYCMTAGTK